MRGLDLGLRHRKAEFALSDQTLVLMFCPRVALAGTLPLVVTGALFWSSAPLSKSPSLSTLGTLLVDFVAWGLGGVCAAGAPEMAPTLI